MTTTENQKLPTELYMEGLVFLRRFNVFLSPHPQGEHVFHKVLMPMKPPTLQGVAPPVRFQPLQEVRDLEGMVRVEGVIEKMPLDLREFWAPLLGPGSSNSPLAQTTKRISDCALLNGGEGDCDDLLSDLLELVPTNQQDAYSAFFDYLTQEVPSSDLRSWIELEVLRHKQTDKPSAPTIKAKSRVPKADFRPQSLSNTEGEEKSYRRGFDQGVAAVLYALGLDGDVVSQLHFKQRSAEFREGLQKYPPWNASAKERTEIVDAVLSAATDQRQSGEDEA